MNACTRSVAAKVYLMARLHRLGTPPSSKASTYMRLVQSAQDIMHLLMRAPFMTS